MIEINPNAAMYADKVRIRVCGICIQDNKLLLVRHQATIKNQVFWAPPGGGLQFGETIEACLKREMLEETGLIVDVTRFLFVNEFLQAPLHALELFFEVKPVSGTIATGTDPEAAPDMQLIEEVAWKTKQEVNAIPLTDKHSILHHLYSFNDLLSLPHHFLK
ncbi:NUDIX domain-containing protein [Pontibacter burrus]|uniref:NUDIX hydrolase n=1 Tax=Pontibacter burrus TaxID=2704466 RepID=A0A6B3LWG6_9BACT|nr:NUDIX hydrolase [Pontibacter burrus]NEM97791.1 NUDIX hydrolase [Pontibacter burrus]